MASYVNVFFQPLESVNATISSGTLTYLDLFGISTDCWVIVPASTTPTQTFTEANLDSTFRQTFTDDFTCTAASFTNSAWVSAGWTAGTFATFAEEELVNWASNNFPTKYRTMNLLLLYGNIGGTDYRIPIFYMGNDPGYGTTTYGTGLMFKKKLVNFQNGNGTTYPSIGSWSKDNTRYIGANCPVSSTNRGLAYIYTIDSDLGMTYEATLTDPAPANGNYFGGFTWDYPLMTLTHQTNFTPSVAIDKTGTRCIVGAPGTSTYTGAIHIYLRTGTSWALEQTIGGEAANDGFGVTVAISDAGDRIAVGGPGNDASRTNGGAVYVYSRSGTTWSLEQKLTLAASTYFGWANDTCAPIAFDAAGSKLVAPCMTAQTSSVFSRSGTTWSLEGTLSGYCGGMSDDGLRVPTGYTRAAPSTSRIYAYSGSWGIEKATGTANTCGFSISPDGRWSFEALTQGHIVVWRRNGTTWTQHGTAIASANSYGPRCNDRHFSIVDRTKSTTWCFLLPTMDL